MKTFDMSLFSFSEADVVFVEVIGKIIVKLIMTHNNGYNYSYKYSYNDSQFIMSSYIYNFET